LADRPWLATHPTWDTGPLKPSDAFRGVATLIPAFNPDKRLLDLVRALREAGCETLVVVNDGSDQHYQEVFDELRNNEVTVVDHEHNKGKGAALKTGFNAITDQFGSLRGVLTADADGQHLPQDIARLAAAAADRPDAIHLGCRSFEKGTPLRSLVGNRATAFFMAFVHGIRLSDTQTGLRYLPADVLPALKELDADGYEFELQCLIRARQIGVELAELPITTVYIDDNASSHFMPVKDSLRIYAVLVRFSGSSIACFGIDIGLFTFLHMSGAGVVQATIAARIVSGLANFSINKFLVFKRREVDGTVRQAFGYVSLWLILMFASASIVSIVDSHRTALVVAVKILVDVSLFLLRYFVQSRFVFRSPASNSQIIPRRF
jgi:glycosyltransferase involved in cell wall biosynthesis